MVSRIHSTIQICHIRGKGLVGLKDFKGIVYDFNP